MYAIRSYYEFGQFLAPAQLLHQELGILQGPLFATDVVAVQGQQVFGAAEGILEGIEGGIDLRRLAHGLQAFRFGRGGEFVGVELALQPAIMLRQLGAIQLKLGPEVEQLEIIHGIVCYLMGGRPRPGAWRASLT